MKHTRLLINTFALAALAAGVCACQSGSTASAGHKPADTTSAAGQAGSGSALTAGATISTGPGSYILQAMPTGTVSFLRVRGHLEARVVLYGLTPGSAHDVAIDGSADSSADSSSAVRFPALTADSAGRVSTTLTSVGTFTKLASGGKFVILLGSAATSGGTMAQQAIAETGVLPVHPIPLTVYPLRALTDDGSLTQPAGRTTITYNATAQTLTVSVTASGLTPGAHAAHIHLGSCQSQGPVKYMLPDFVADAGGNIVDQTRVVTGVSSVPGPGAWYLNLHLGGMNQILANGSPTLYFRPMLCTNITSFATVGGASGSGSGSSAAPQPTGSSSPAMMMPTSTPSPGQTATVIPSSSPSPTYTVTPTASASITPSAQPSATWTAIPSAQPTHW